MGGEIRRMEVVVTTLDYEKLPPHRDTGEQMYANDVVEEVSKVVETALAAWYKHRGRHLLGCEPDVI